MVDTNIVAYFVIGGLQTGASEAVRSADKQWFAPALLRYELLSVITMHIQKNLLTRDEGIRAYRRGISLVRFHESLPDPIQILTLTETSKCSSYDCVFVALAQIVQTRFVTTDKEILKSFPLLAVHPQNFR